MRWEEWFDEMFRKAPERPSFNQVLVSFDGWCAFNRMSRRRNRP